jgi:hypothetical protein
LSGQRTAEPWQPTGGRLWKSSPTGRPTTGSRSAQRPSCEAGKKINPAPRDEDVPKLRRQVEAICAAGSPPFDPRDAPALTRDPEDDPILYTALLGDADLLVADDRHIVPDGVEPTTSMRGGSLPP